MLLIFITFLVGFILVIGQELKYPKMTMFYLFSGPEEYSVEIENLVDIRTERNFEMGMKISTNVKNDGIFYTDLNGYQVGTSFKIQLTNFFKNNFEISSCRSSNDNSWKNYLYKPITTRCRALFISKTKMHALP